MIPLFIWILCLADIVYLIKIDILGSRIKVMKKWCLRIFIWRYKGICLLYSPRMWRWSSEELIEEWCGFVFSTYVEVILWLSLCWRRLSSILHVCGGDPSFCRSSLKTGSYSPRMWRWSLCNDLSLFNGGSILHVCGGDPDYINKRMKQIEYSPRMWRWSLL